MDQHISNIASNLRGAAPKSNIFTISTTTLSYILSAFEGLEFPSFHTAPRSHLDLHFLYNYIQNTKNLKIYSDSPHEVTDLNQFKKVLQIEFCKLDLKLVKGLQLLRPQLQKLVCYKTGNSLNDVLGECGGDQSLPYCWNELKEASFIGNGICEIDKSLECAIWLHTLDLSHNEITEIDNLSSLPNLKALNLAYNKLEKIPQLKGQICSRLQNLVLKNNFIEDISGLRHLTNLWQLDLSSNVLISYKSLVTLSHLATLQSVNLKDNPLFFHPSHRSKTALYLHGNTASTQFILNDEVLSANEKKLVGSFHPLPNSSMTDSFVLSVDKARRVREVVIEEEEVKSVVVPVAPPQQHLETKRQIEDLHEKFGESWLNSQSGLLDVLGLESSMNLSRSPYMTDLEIYSDVDEVEIAEDAQFEDYKEACEEEHKEEDVDVENEESIYLASLKNETDTIFIVITPTHFCERDSEGGEREKWHLESIISCQITDDGVQIDFETMRKDRKQRIYVFEEEMEAFVDCINNKINTKPKKEEGIKYQCMKCSNVFVKVGSASILEENVIKCPNCDSTLVVEA